MNFNFAARLEFIKDLANEYECVEARFDLARFKP